MSARVSPEVLRDLRAKLAEPAVTGSDDLVNNSTVTGSTITDALNTLDGSTGGSSNGVTNDSTVPGATVTDALEANAAAAAAAAATAGTADGKADTNTATIAGLGSDDIANDSTLNGGAGTVTDALNAAGGGGPSGSDSVTNESTVTGATVSDAMETNAAAIAGLDSDAIANTSTVTGATVTAALSALDAATGGPTGSDSVTNESTVTGATVSDALETNANAIGSLGTNSVTNQSTVTGVTTTNALETNAAAILANAVAISNLDSDDIVNVSTVNGGTGSVSSALQVNAAAIAALDSDDIANTTATTGANVSGAINTLAADIFTNTSAISALSSDDIANDSTLNGGAGTVTDALNAAGGGGGGGILGYYHTDRPSNPNTSPTALFIRIGDFLNTTSDTNTNWCGLFVSATVVTTEIGTAGDITIVNGRLRFNITGTFHAVITTTLRAEESSSGALADYYFGFSLDTTPAGTAPDIAGRTSLTAKYRATADIPEQSRTLVMSDTFDISSTGTTWDPYMWSNTSGGNTSGVHLESGQIDIYRVA